jgi:hypothetical protein
VVRDQQKPERSPRDILLDQVRRGQKTPEQAEQAAAMQGFGPLATKLDPVAFDPDQMLWWSLPMAVAWIAWRKSASVSEHCAEYEEPHTRWVPGSWNVLINGGEEVERIDGHELKTLGPPTLGRLLQPPATRAAVVDAEQQLFAGLAAGRITAIAKDAEGNAVEIPKREWPYLELFEDGQKDVFKRGDLLDSGLDSWQAFSEIKLSRDELKQVWPEHAPVMRDGSTLPAIQRQIREVTKRIWSDGGVPTRVKDRDAAISKWFSDNGQTVPSERTIRRALSDQ